jgi:hypothetical protein
MRVDVDGRDGRLRLYDVCCWAVERTTEEGDGRGMERCRKRRRGYEGRRKEEEEGERGKQRRTEDRKRCYLAADGDAQMPPVHTSSLPNPKIQNSKVG